VLAGPQNKHPAVAAATINDRAARLRSEKIFVLTMTWPRSTVLMMLAIVARSGVAGTVAIVIGGRTHRFVCLVWPAVSSIRDCVAVAKTRASAALPDVCPAESATSWLRTSSRQGGVLRRDDLETRTVAQGTQIVHLRAAREIKFLKRENELQTADAGIGDVAAERGRASSGRDSFASSSRPLFACNPEVEYLKRGNELQTADAGIRHVAVSEVELLQGATALQAAHVRYFLQPRGRVPQAWE
jgi:hypothetical protein